MMRRPMSFTAPQEALGQDVGDGVIIRYKEKTKEVVGITIIGVRQRTLGAMRGKRQ